MSTEPTPTTVTADPMQGLTDEEIGDAYTTATGMHIWGEETHAKIVKFARDMIAVDRARTAIASLGVPADLGQRYSVEFDGFTGTVIGSYCRLDGEEGVVMQQDGCKVVHVYRRKWLTPVAPSAAGSEGAEPNAGCVVHGSAHPCEECAQELAATPAPEGQGVAKQPAAGAAELYGFERSHLEDVTRQLSGQAPGFGSRRDAISFIHAALAASIAQAAGPAVTDEMVLMALRVHAPDLWRDGLKGYRDEPTTAAFMDRESARMRDSLAAALASQVQAAGVSETASKLEAVRFFWQQHTLSDALSMTMPALHNDAEMVIRGNRPAAPAHPIAAPATPTDTQLLDFLVAHSLDLQCTEIPTGQGDADVGWFTTAHHMSKPRERVVSEVSCDDPRQAIREAMARLKRDPYCTGPLHLEDATPTPGAEPAPTQPAVQVPVAGEDREDMILVPRGLIGAACSVIDKKRDGTKILEKLRRYTTGDLSTRPTQPDAAPVAEPAVQRLPAGIIKLCYAAQALIDVVDERHEKAEAPLKYTVPWGAVVDLRHALELIAAPAMQGGVAVAAEWLDMMRSKVNTLATLSTKSERHRFAMGIMRHLAAPGQAEPAKGGV